MSKESRAARRAARRARRDTTPSTSKALGPVFVKPSEKATVEKAGVSVVTPGGTSPKTSGSGSSSSSSSQANLKAQQEAQAKAERDKKIQEDFQKKSDARQQKIDLENLRKADLERKRIEAERQRILRSGGRSKTTELKNKQGDTIRTTITEIDKIENGKKIKSRIFTTTNLRTGVTSTKTFDYDTRTRRTTQTGGLSQQGYSRKDLKEIQDSLPEGDTLMINSRTGQPVGIKSGTLKQSIPFTQKGIDFYNKEIKKRFEEFNPISFGQKILTKAKEERAETLSELQVIQQARAKEMNAIEDWREAELNKVKGLTGEKLRTAENRINRETFERRNIVKAKYDKRGIKLFGKAGTETLTILAGKGIIALEKAQDFVVSLTKDKEVRKDTLGIIKEIPKVAFKSGVVIGMAISGDQESKDKINTIRNSTKTFIQNEVQGFGTLLKTAPTEAILVIGSEILTLYMIGGAFRVASSVGKGVVKGTIKISGKLISKSKLLTNFVRIAGKPVRFVSKAGSNVVKISKATAKQVLTATKKGVKKAVKKIIDFKKTRGFEGAFRKTISQIEKQIGEKLTAKEKFFIKNRLKLSVRQQTLKGEILREMRKALLKAGKTRRINRLLLSVLQQIKRISPKKFKRFRRKVAREKKRITKAIQKQTTGEKIAKLKFKKIKKIKKRLPTRIKKAIAKRKKMKERIARAIALRGKIKIKPIKFKFDKSKKLSKKIRDRILRNNEARARIEGAIQRQTVGGKIAKLKFKKIKKIKKRLPKKLRDRIAKNRKSRERIARAIQKQTTGEKISKLTFKKVKKKFTFKQRSLIKKAKKEKERIRRAIEQRGKGEEVKIPFKINGKDFGKVLTRETRVSKKLIQNEKQIAEIIKKNLKNIKIQSTAKIRNNMRKKVMKIVAKVRPVFLVDGRRISTKAVFKKMKTSKQFNEFIEKKVIPSLESTSKKGSSRLKAKITGRGSQQLIQVHKIKQVKLKRISMKVRVRQRQLKAQAPQKLKPVYENIANNLERLSLSGRMGILSLNVINQVMGDVNKFYSRERVDSLSDSKITTSIKNLSKVTSVEKVDSKVNSRIIQNIKAIERIIEREKSRTRLREVTKQVREKKKPKSIIIRLRKKRTQYKTLAIPTMTFKVLGKIRGKSKLLLKDLTRKDALNYLAYQNDNTLMRTVRLLPSGKKRRVVKLPSKFTGYYGKTKHKLREFKIDKGKKKPLDGYIEKLKYSGDTKMEIAQLQLARRLKKKVVKRKSNKKKTSKKK